MKKGFTMIELIFVIVILGILAAVAIPKMAATRDDAKVSSIATQVQAAISEIPQYITAKGVEANATALTTQSQVLNQLVSSGKATENTVANKKSVSIYGAGTSACITLETNSTNLEVKYSTADTSAICNGIKGFVKEANYSVAGSSVVY
jgi:general secretion pathway protein G